MTLKKHKAFGNEAGRYAVLPNRRQGTRKGQASHSGFPSRPWPPEAGPASASLSLGAWRVHSAAHHAFGHRSVGTQGFLGDSRVHLPIQETRETRVRSLGWEDPLEEEPAALPSILAWEIPMDRGGWRATVHGGTKSQGQLDD